MFSKATIVAFALAAVSNAHMIMTSPVPYGVGSLDNSPLAADGSDFPCKQRSGVYQVSTQNTMDLGGSYDLAFKGSAVHGGGSCQVSITYDENPTAKSTFKVIHSIVGGCPMKNTPGNAPSGSPGAVDPDTYNFTIPTDLPSGKATLAWTWFNKVGNREMYMNCAPVTLNGGSSKRHEIVQRDQAAYSALPDMFVANIGNGCGTAESLDLVFPNPGDSVDFEGGSTSTATAAPTGTCAKATGGSGSAAPQPTGGASSVATSAASAGTASASLPGGVFVTIATGTSASAATSAPSVTPVTSAPAVATSAVSVPTKASSAVAPVGTGSTSTSPSSGGLTGPCTSEGMFNCVGSDSFQQCASGTWSVVHAMADGTTCKTGQTMNLAVAKRGGKHVMRHVARRHLGNEMFF